jgi:hypothetical protein
MVGYGNGAQGQTPGASKPFSSRLCPHLINLLSTPPVRGRTTASQPRGGRSGEAVLSRQGMDLFLGGNATGAWHTAGSCSMVASLSESQRGRTAVTVADRIPSRAGPQPVRTSSGAGSRPTRSDSHPCAGGRGMATSAVAVYGGSRTSNRARRTLSAESAVTAAVATASRESAHTSTPRCSGQAA